MEEGWWVEAAVTGDLVTTSCTETTTANVELCCWWRRGRSGSWGRRDGSLEEKEKAVGLMYQSATAVLCPLFRLKPEFSVALQSEMGGDAESKKLTLVV